MHCISVKCFHLCYISTSKINLEALNNIRVDFFRTVIVKLPVHTKTDISSSFNKSLKSGI